MRLDILRRLLFCCILLQSIHGDATETSFAIVITAHNVKEGFQKNLDSVFGQTYPNYRVIYLADGSTDGSEPLVENYIKMNRREEQVMFFKTRERKGALACTCQAVFSCRGDEVIVELDGNDQFADCEVLSRLNALYADPNVWMTYESPLTSFYAALFHFIPKEDFLDGEKFLSQADAHLMPMLAMAGDHVRSEIDIGKNLSKYSPLTQLSVPILPVYDQVSDLFHPTPDDYRCLQEYLLCGKRKNLDRLGNSAHLMRQMKLIGDTSDESPISECIPVNCQDTDRENCILIYATFNRNYPNALKRLLKWIVESDYKGHVLYRLGGWPDTEGGSLVLSHVPYGFKCSFFKEAQRLKFKRILWLDSAVVPLASLNEIFSMIQEKGYFVMGNPCVIAPFMNRQAAAYFGLTLQQTFQIPSCAAGLFGVDLTQQVGTRLLESWYRAACDNDSFFSTRSDQNALSILLYQHRLFDFTDIRRMPHAEKEIQPDSLFFLDREFTRQ